MRPRVLVLLVVLGGLLLLATPGMVGCTSDAAVTPSSSGAPTTLSPATSETASLLRLTKRCE